MRIGAGKRAGKAVFLWALSFFLICGLLDAAPTSAPPPFPDFGSQDVLLLEDGSLVKGQIKEVTPDGVEIVVRGALKRYGKDEVWTVSRGDREARKEIRNLWRRTENTPAAWYSLGYQCYKRKLKVEAVFCFKHVLRLDPEHRKAHLALGHAQLNGVWLDRAEVKKKLKEGYKLQNGILVPPGSKGTEVTEVKKEEKWPLPKRRILPEPKWSAKDLARFAAERKKRRRDAEEFQKQMAKEYLGVPWSKHYEIKTPHYVIQCNSTREVTKRYADLMEKLYAVLAKHFPAERKGRRGKSLVRIYRNGDDFRGETGMFWGVGGFYDPLSGVLCAYHGTFGMTSTTFNVLAHEGTHQFQGKVLRDFRNVPMWLIEGLAVYFGDGARIDPSGKIVTERIPRDRLLHIQDKIRTETYTPLGKLVALDRRHFTGSHYADSWALIHFLVNSGKKGQELLSSYWNIAQKRRITYEDFETLAKLHSGSLKQLEKKYIKHVMSLRPDPAGEIRGTYFYSREFCFEFERLGPGWKFYEDYKRGFLVGQCLPGTSAQIEIYFANNDERAHCGQDYVKKFVSRYLEGYLRNRYRGVVARRVKIHGRRAFGFVYEDGAPDGSASVGTTISRFTNPFESDPFEKKDNPRKYLEFLIVDFDGCFSIRASCYREEFEKYRSAFAKVREAFIPVYQRRW